MSRAGLMGRIAARLDEIGQIEDDLSDQKTAVAKAELALAVARREAEIADLAPQRIRGGDLSPRRWRWPRGS